MKPAELLVVEDLDDRRAKCLAVAREVGFQAILEAASVAQAEDLIREHLVPIAVIDLGLPPEPGGEASEQGGLDLIASLHEAQPRCKIVAVTGLYDTEQGIKALEAGALDFISSKWLRINFYDLLEQKLRMYRGLVLKYGGRAQQVAN